MKRPLLLFLTIALGVISCEANTKQENVTNMLRFFKKGDPIEKFWTWFKENEKRLRKIEEDPGKYLTAVLTQAKTIQSGLAIEFEPPKNGIINMTVSADGDRNLFIVVQNVVDKAAIIEGWKFIAFRQRMDLEKVKGMKLKVSDHELDPVKMKFFPIVNGDTLDLIIYAEGVTEESYNQIAYGGLLLLDNILGEYDCVTKVRSYDFHNMPIKKGDLDDLHPLLDLAAYVDKFYTLKKQ